MMKVITKTPNEYGSYGTLMEYDGIMLPEDFLEVPDWVNTEEFVEYEGFVFVETLRGCVIAMSPNLEAWEAWKALQPDPVETAKTEKNAEIAAACSAMIDVGTEVQLPDGSKKAYTYTVEDQANVSEMFLACMSGATGYVYHANGEECRTYTAAEIVAIYGTLSMYKTGQITYQNQLKKLVEDQTTVDAVNKITYGQPLEGNYLEKYNQLMAEAKTQMEAVLSKIAGAVSE